MIQKLTMDRIVCYTLKSSAGKGHMTICRNDNLSGADTVSESTGIHGQTSPLCATDFYYKLVYLRGTDVMTFTIISIVKIRSHIEATFDHVCQSGLT